MGIFSFMSVLLLFIVLVGNTRSFSKKGKRKKKKEKKKLAMLISR